VFGTCNARNLQDSFTKTALNKLAKCRLSQVAVYEVRWDEGRSQPADDYTFLYQWNTNRHLPI